MIAEAEDYYSTPPDPNDTAAEAEKKRVRVQKVQTDLGSEFMKEFRQGLKAKQRATGGDKYYKHVYGYTGRSHSQALVERVQGTLKRLLHKSLQPRVQWEPKLVTAVANYNNNYHSTIKMTPNSVSHLGRRDNWRLVKRHIINRAKRRKTIQPQVFVKGDYVRLKLYEVKGSSLKPRFSFKGGPLYTLANDNNIANPNNYRGVFVVSGGIWCSIHVCLFIQ